MADEWFLQKNPDGKIESQIGTGKLLGRLCDKSIVLNSPTGLTDAGAAKIFQCRPYWCWKVEGWGGNSSNDPTWCSRFSGGRLGDAGQDYQDAIHCPGSSAGGITWSRIGPFDTFDAFGDYSIVSWNGSKSAFGNYTEFVQVSCGDGWGDPDLEAREIDGVMLQFRLHNSNSEAAFVSYRKHWEFPVNLWEVLQAICDVDAEDIESIDSDPDNPTTWVPWCRGNGGTCTLSIW
jgi:hypothetical protein